MAHFHLKTDNLEVYFNHSGQEARNDERQPRREQVQSEMRAEIRTLQDEVTRLVATLEANDERVADMEGRLARRDRRVGLLDRDIMELRRRVLGLENEVAVVRGENVALRGDIGGIRTEVLDLRGEARELRDMMAERDERWAEEQRTRTQEIEELRNREREREDRWQRRNEERREQLEARDGRIAELGAGMERMRFEVDESRNNIANLRNDIIRGEQRLQAGEREVERMKREALRRQERDQRRRREMADDIARFEIQAGRSMELIERLQEENAALGARINVLEYARYDDAMIHGQGQVADDPAPDEEEQRVENLTIKTGKKKKKKRCCSISREKLRRFMLWTTT